MTVTQNPSTNQKTIVFFKLINDQMTRDNEIIMKQVLPHAFDNLMYAIIQLITYDLEIFKISEFDKVRSYHDVRI